MANNSERLGQINIRYISTNTYCACCNNIFNEEKMWHVLRWGEKKNINSYYYCFNCTKTKKDVLNIIDTDDCKYGIFPVDNMIIRKKTIEEMEKHKNKNKNKPTMHEKRNRLYKKKVLKKY